MRAYPPAARRRGPKPGSPNAAGRNDAWRRGRGLGFEGATGIETGTIARRSASSWILTTTGIQGHSSRVFSETLGYGAIFEASRIINSFREELAEEGIDLISIPWVNKDN